MNTATIRQQLHNYLEVAEDKKVKAFCTLFEADIKESTVEYSEELKAELDARYKAYKSGKGNMISPAESKVRIDSILGRKK